MTAGMDEIATDLRRIDGPRPDPAQGVFETTLVTDGRPVALEAHLARLEASLRSLYDRSAPPGLPELVADAAAGLRLGRLRLTVVPAGGELVADVRTAEVDDALVFPTAERALELEPVIVPGGIGAHKWADRRLLERAESETAPALPLIVDADGTLLEGSRSSLFLVRDGALHTPAADGRLLPGITRAQALAAAADLGIDVHERALGLDDAAAADDAFMTGAVRGVESVRRLGALREWAPDGVAPRLAARLRRMWMG
jgi:para-aminobenzoate synthetase/4-amino-4-deoxychorismate lyase